ncbi:MAG: polymer-forming cytoskeletal protein [Candidatus Latescibacterota bacterium]|nr:MAG: polymer-forming cytoskeletal protein [Candidatus Latescibacterota bacterium]RKY74909.1 MAG: polymer-forming cytoskeletal protein [Candidatus Latescibacterota bacterium]HDH99982.1 polymer-forming cytoskeletal protein [Bacillota bacterium]
MPKNDVGAINTLIGKGSEVEGKLSVENSIRVDGRVKGELKCSGLLVIGEEGVVEADIQAKEVVVGGKVQGSVDASHKVVLQSSASVIGDLRTRLLVVEEGAVFKGNCTSGAPEAKTGDEGKK